MRQSAPVRARLLNFEILYSTTSASPLPGALRFQLPIPDQFGMLPAEAFRDVAVPPANRLLCGEAFRKLLRGGSAHRSPPAGGAYRRGFASMVAGPSCEISVRDQRGGEEAKRRCPRSPENVIVVTGYAAANFSVAPGCDRGLAQVGVLAVGESVTQGTFHNVVVNHCCLSSQENLDGSGCRSAPLLPRFH
jgi:hypothetical protein